MKKIAKVKKQVKTAESWTIVYVRIRRGNLDNMRKYAKATPGEKMTDVVSKAIEEFLESNKLEKF